MGQTMQNLVKSAVKNLKEVYSACISIGAS